MPEKGKRNRPNFSINVVLPKKRFERLERHDEKWFKNYSDCFSIKIDKPALTKRLAFVLSLLSDFSSSVNLRFCDDVEMEQTNQEFRGKSEPTDVLSFPTSPFEARDPEAMEKLEEPLGDILICVPVCECQAREAGHSLSRELEKMLIHGLVHLKGFDHERNDNAWRVMQGLEELIEKETTLTQGEPSWCGIESSGACAKKNRSRVSQ